ncbi:MAG: hypothetical protein LBC99_01955 [Spirochaetota bacterium]|jgi:arsenate reductase-like glutaredoxin family protein|nr:hypothetical protein [Spirochaetota bacterium]
MSKKFGACIYRDTSSKGRGRKADRWRAEFYVNGVRYRKSSASRDALLKWLKSRGEVSPSEPREAKGSIYSETKKQIRGKPWTGLCAEIEINCVRYRKRSQSRKTLETWLEGMATRRFSGTIREIQLKKSIQEASMEAGDLAGKRIKITKSSIALLDAHDKVAGMITGVKTFFNTDGYERMELFSSRVNVPAREWHRYMSHLFYIRGVLYFIITDSAEKIHRDVYGKNTPEEDILRAGDIGAHILRVAWAHDSRRT